MRFRNDHWPSRHARRAARRPHGLWLVVAAMLLVGCGWETRQPNIVVVVADDHRPDVMSAAGNPHIVTPNLDRLVAEGAHFREAFSTSGMCAPARAALFTGKHAHATGVPIQLPRCRTFAARETPFPARLQAAGYVTAHIGKWHLGRDHLPHTGYDHWFGTRDLAYRDATWWRDGTPVKTPPGTWTDPLLASEAAALIDRYAAGSSERPFALVVALRAPHPPFETTDEQRRAMAAAQIPTPVGFAHEAAVPGGRLDVRGPLAMGLFGGSWDRFIQAYYGTVLGIDQALGTVLDALDRNDVARDTLVIYTSDQGIALGERGDAGKLHGHDQAMRVPLLARYPAQIPAGVVRDELALITDVAPTVLDYAGVDMPSGVHGRSLRPLMGKPVSSRDGVVEDWRNDFLYEYWFYERDNRRAQLAVRTQDHKLVVETFRRRAGRSLYDLRADPFELDNRVDDPAFADIRADLETRLERLKSETGWFPMVQHRMHGFWALGPLPADTPDLFERWGATGVNLAEPVMIGDTRHLWRAAPRANHNANEYDLGDWVEPPDGRVTYLAIEVHRTVDDMVGTMLRVSNKTGYLEAMTPSGSTWTARPTSARTWSERVLDLPLTRETTFIVARVRAGETRRSLQMRLFAPQGTVTLPDLAAWRAYASGS